VPGLKTEESVNAKKKYEQCSMAAGSVMLGPAEPQGRAGAMPPMPSDGPYLMMELSVLSLENQRLTRALAAGWSFLVVSSNSSSGPVSLSPSIHASLALISPLASHLPDSVALFCRTRSRFPASKVFLRPCAAPGEGELDSLRRDLPTGVGPLHPEPAVRPSTVT
jgi:hypothetical protein